MKNSISIFSACLIMAACSVQAGTIQANFGHPEMGAFAIQKKNNSATATYRRDGGSAYGGQSFKVDAETTLRAVTFQKQATTTYSGSPSEIWLFVGEYTNGVIASTNLLDTFDVTGSTLTNAHYYSLNLDADLVLSPGTYTYQIWFAQANESHALTMKTGTATTYTNGTFFYQPNAVDFPKPSYTESSAVGTDYTFGLHSEVVGVIPTVVNLSSEEITMDFTVDLDEKAGNTSIGYSTVSGSNVVVSSIMFSDETHANAFTNLTALPLVLTTPLPTTTPLEFKFDNTIAGLAVDEMATATATIDWYEEGGTNGQFIVSLSALALEVLPSSSITNTGSAFPTNDIVLSQEILSTDGASFIKDTLGGGQTFTLDANKTISGFTFYVKNGATLDDTEHSLKVWVGEMNGTTAGETILESSIDVSGHSLASGSYQRIDFTEELNLSEGSYGVQLAWGEGAVGIRLGNSATNVYDGGTGQRFGYSGTLPVNGGAFAWDYVFALHGVDGPDGYDAWLLDYDLGAESGKTDNPDGDAYNNLYEYAFGGNPTNAADIGYMNPLGYSLLEDGSTYWFEYVYARRIAATNELVYSLEMATDLVASNWAARAYTELPEAGVVEDDADFETVTNRIDTTGQNVEFIRVDVEEL
ncbi:hypothetical protein P4B35_06005 [Pontiellaceae bacterium B12227]|nr:hypothetical protein [Pontiellaceae bacterium B12227]